MTGLFSGFLFLVVSITSLIIFFVLIHHPTYHNLATVISELSHSTLLVFCSLATLIAFIKIRKLRFQPGKPVVIFSFFFSSLSLHYPRVHRSHFRLGVSLFLSFALSLLPSSPNHKGGSLAPTFFFFISSSLYSLYLSHSSLVSIFHFCDIDITSFSFSLPRPPLSPLFILFISFPIRVPLKV